MEYKIEKFTINDIKIDVMVDQARNTIWLTRKQMSILFNTSVDNIALHIKNIFKDEKFDDSVYEESSATASDGKKYRVKIYNLHIILEIGNRTRSQKGIELKKWVEKYFEDTENKNKEFVQIEDKDSFLYEYEVVKYKNDGVELDVKVSPNEDTVWLTQKQICTLFGTNKSTLSFHIANILSLEELGNSVVRKNRTTASDRKNIYGNTSYR